MPQAILLVLVAISLLCALATHLAAHVALARRPAKPRGPLPPITILRSLPSSAIKVSVRSQSGSSAAFFWKKPSWFIPSG